MGSLSTKATFTNDNRYNDIAKGITMKTYDCIICLEEQQVDATCRITEINNTKWLGHSEISIEVEMLTIAYLPISMFKDEIVEEAASQCRHDPLILMELAGEPELEEAI